MKFAGNSFVSSKTLGSIRLCARYSEERILPSQYYQPLVDLLVESVQDTEVISTWITISEFRTAVVWLCHCMAQ